MSEALNLPYYCGNKITSLVKKPKGIVCTRKFTKYENVILRNIWLLDNAYLNLLDTNETYITKIGRFINSLEPEKFPATYQDTYVTEAGANFYVCYLFCSGQFLDDLSERTPEQLVAFQLRSNEANNFKICVVRLWDTSWNKAAMIAGGAKEI